jgi:hypothetical protein
MSWGGAPDSLIEERLILLNGRWQTIQTREVDNSGLSGIYEIRKKLGKAIDL